MFDLSNNNPIINFNFQRATPQSSIIDALGREPTEEEITNAKQNVFSVDNVFCNVCEDKFTTIEDSFTKNILPKLRGNDLTGISQISFAENIIIRRFFLLQVWRASVCDPDFKISPTLQNALHEIILNGDIEREKVIAIPLNITYLNTLGNEIEYTSNLVGRGNIEGNQVIFMNDFIIQTFENAEEIKLVEFMGINEQKTFKYFTNVKENEFVFKVLDNEQRIEASNKYIKDEKLYNHLSFYKYIFQKKYFEIFGQNPSIELFNKYLYGIINGTDCTNETRYTCLLYTSPSPRDGLLSRMPSSA